MRSRLVSSLLLAWLAVSVCAAQTSGPEKQKFSPPSRKFVFTYAFTVKDIPAGSKLVRVWVPVAHTDEHQTVRLVKVKAPVETRMGEEPEYGNHILYAEIRNPAQTSVDFTLEYEVTRREYSRGDYAQLESKDTKPGRGPGVDESLSRARQAHSDGWQDQRAGYPGDGQPDRDGRQSESCLRLSFLDHAL